MQSTIVEGFRLSPQQRRLWRFQQDGTLDALAFNSHLALLLEGELRSDALRAALQKLCARHESLRSTFQRLPGVVMPVQSVHDDLTPSWNIVDVSGMIGREQAARVEELLALENGRRFNLDDGPLVHATLYVLSSGRHLLSISLPALCADHRTLSNLSAELSKCYREIVKGGAEEAEHLQYTQFSEWQNTLSEEADAEVGKEYWRKQDLSAASAVLPLRQRVRSVTPAGTFRELHSVTMILPPEFTAGATALAKKYETTSATVLLSAWQTLLWRMTQQAVVIGHVCDGRPYEELNDAFGLFARVLPVSCQFMDGLRFSEVITQIDSFQRETEEWQDYFDWDQPAEDALKYFSFGYEYADLPIPWYEGGLQFSVYRQQCYSERFDLKLSCAVERPALELEFQYDNALFREDDIRRLAGQFRTLLDAALTDPEALIEELKIVSVDERKQIVFDWNKTQRDYPHEQCFHELFEEQVERTPDALATVFQDQQLTFAELNRRANQLAHHLQTLGVGPETVVGLCVETSLEMLTGILGILKAGGAYLPLDPRNPPERLNQVLSDAGASVLLTQEHLSTGRFDVSFQLIRLDTDWEKISAESVVNPRSGVDANNLAYIIYTSGSTGQPKGVMIQHVSVVNLAAALREEVYAGLGTALKVGLSAPLAFDASVKQLLQLLSGNTLHVLPEELRLDAMRALAYLKEHALDVLDCTPSQLKLLLAAGLNDAARNLPKLMLVGGEALDESLWSRLAENQATRFYNVYGPTECTVDATWILVTSAAESPTIGRPIPNAQAYILDKDLEPVGILLTGELYIGGAGVARGYLNWPERTAERFVPDGLSGQPGARLYRTGDLARYSPGASISFAGRNDSQVKVRGHRIELGEIEAVLNQHEKVRQAVVVAREDPSAGVRLVGYVVSEGAETLDVRELRRTLSERLPDYMMPSFLVAIDELPLTRNGKVDLNALPAPEAVRPPPDKYYVPPRNEIEETITRVWQEVLGVERIGVHDNFFDAGGHSLLMLQVHDKLTAAFSKEVSIVDMFAKPTISALAEYFSDTNGHQPSFQKTMDRAARRKQAAARRQS